MICNFVPCKVDYHPLGVPVPYYHSNVDSDEMKFYVGGYEARKGSGIGVGSVSSHPDGRAHGPGPARRSGRSEQSSTTSSRLWSTRFARWRWAKPVAPWMTVCTR